MLSPRLIAFAAALALGLSAFAWADGMWPFRSDLLAACEDLIAARLRAPSTFRRVTLRERSDTLSASEFLELRMAELGAQETGDVRTFLRQQAVIHATAIAAGKATARLNHVTVTYDAENAYGKPVRNEGVCYFLESPGGTFAARNVTLDGMTGHQWRMHEIEAMREAAGEGG